MDEKREATKKQTMGSREEHIVELGTPCFFGCMRERVNYMGDIFGTTDRKVCKLKLKKRGNFETSTSYSISKTSGPKLRGMKIHGGITHWRKKKGGGGNGKKRVVRRKRKE